MRNVTKNLQPKVDQQKNVTRKLSLVHICRWHACGSTQAVSQGLGSIADKLQVCRRQASDVP